MLNFGHNCAVKICSQERLLLFTPIFSLPMGGPPIPTFCLSLPAFASHSEFLPPDLHITRWVGAHLLPPLLPTPIFCLPFLPLPSFSSHISTFFSGVWWGGLASSSNSLLVSHLRPHSPRILPRQHQTTLCWSFPQ